MYDEAVVIALGSNLGGAWGSPRAVLEAALEALPGAGIRVVSRSSWWRSKAWPNPADPDYLNGVAIVETALPPREAMTALVEIERAFGRERGAANAARTLDLDLIAYGRTVYAEEGLTLPHPRAAERRFVMGPLAEIAPTWRHPLSGQGAPALAALATVGTDAKSL